MLLETDFCYRRSRWSGTPLYIWTQVGCRVFYGFDGTTTSRTNSIVEPKDRNEEREKELEQRDITSPSTFCNKTTMFMNFVALWGIWYFASSESITPPFPFSQHILGNTWVEWELRSTNFYCISKNLLFISVKTIGCFFASRTLKPLKESIFNVGFATGCQRYRCSSTSSSNWTRPSRPRMRSWGY